MQLISNLKIPSQAEFEAKAKELEKKRKQVTDLESKIKLVRAENQELMKSNSSLLAKLKNYKKEATEYKNLNIDLQKKVIEQMKEYQGIYVRYLFRSDKKIVTQQSSCLFGYLYYYFKPIFFYMEYILYRIKNMYFISMRINLGFFIYIHEIIQIIFFVAVDGSIMIQQQI